MAVQPSESGALHALNSVLQSIESVRNAGALYLLLLGFTSSGLLVAAAQGALARQSLTVAVFYLAAAFFVVFYASNGAGLVLMDEACGRVPRHPADALRDALAQGHRLLLVVGAVVALVAVLVAAVLAGLYAARWPVVGPAVLGVVVAVAVPVVGVAGLALLLLVGPLAAPAVWSGMKPMAVLAWLRQQARQRFAHAVMLAAAVSLLSAGVAGLLSAAVLAGGRLVLGLGLGLVDLDLAPQPVMAALFGQAFRLAPGAAALSAHTTAAINGAAVVFGLGLVLPAAVYLRGLCELFLALQRLDDPASGTLGAPLP